LGREGVPQVVRARARPGPAGEARVLDHLMQRLMRGALMNRRALAGDEHGTLGCNTEAVTDRQPQVTGDGPT
jgi:hypothetical protein